MLIDAKTGVTPTRGKDPQSVCTRRPHPRRSPCRRRRPAATGRPPAVLADVPVAEHVAAQDPSRKGERLAGLVAFTRCADAALLELLARCGDPSLAGRLVFLLG